MKRHDLACELRHRQMNLSDDHLIQTYGDCSRRSRRWHRSVVNRLSDIEVIDCYLTCPCCGERQVEDDLLNTVIDLSVSADHFIELAGLVSHLRGDRS